MNKRNTHREAAINAIADFLLANGLTRTTLKELADAAGTSDRMLLYYFNDKTDLMTEALTELARQLEAALNKAIPVGEIYPASELLIKTGKLTSNKRLRPFIRIWIEVSSAAARQEEPYSTLSRSIAITFLDWIKSRLATADNNAKRKQAAIIFAMIDGNAVLDACAPRKEYQGAFAFLADCLSITE